jgi:hypothetical protein
MSIKLAEVCPDKYEPLDRYCPICDVHILKGDIAHRCDKNTLKKIDKRNKIAIEKEEKQTEPLRTFDEKLEEAQKLMNSDI